MKINTNVIGNKLAQLAKDAGDAVGKTVAQAAEGASSLATEFSSQVGSIATNVGERVMDSIDVNHDGEVNIEDVILLAIKTPGVGIDRAAFLRKELTGKFSEDIVDAAVSTTPASAGISIEDMDRIADSVIQAERLGVSGISVALGTPGGAAMLATIPADIVQYYAYMLRAAQKLMYLYGFPQLLADVNGQVLDSATMNILILCLGAMAGVAGAGNAIKSMAKALASGVEKQLLKKALTKTTIYPIVKRVAKWFGVKMTKEVFAGFFKKAIPLVGGVIGGGITYLSFKPCCEKLKETLRETRLGNPSIQDDAEAIVIEAEDMDEILQNTEVF